MPAVPVVHRLMPGAPPVTRDRLVLAVGPALAGAALVLQLVAPGTVERWGPAVALVGIVLGVPHGAVDHMVPFWTGRRRPTLPALTPVLLGYVAVAGAAALALHVAPGPTVALFLLASAVHFGRAEVVVAAETAGRSVPGPTEQLAMTAAHGLAVVALPVVCWPVLSAEVLGRLAPSWGDPLPPAVRTGLGAGVALVVLASLVRQLQQGHRREATELAVVVALFALVPPLAAFGVWFAGWHALRHTARLLHLMAAVAPGDRPARVLRRFLAHAALPTASTLVAVVVLAGPGASTVAVGAALAVLVALTFPHVRTVAVLDRWAAGRR